MLRPRARHERPWADPSRTGEKMDAALTSSHSPLPSTSLTSPHPLGLSLDSSSSRKSPLLPSGWVSLVPSRGSTAPSAPPPSLPTLGHHCLGTGLSTPLVWGPQEAGQGLLWSPLPAQDGTQRKLSGCQMNELNVQTTLPWGQDLCGFPHSFHWQGVGGNGEGRGLASTHLSCAPQGPVCWGHRH